MKLSPVLARILAALLFCCPQLADNFAGVIDPAGLGEIVSTPEWTFYRTDLKRFTRP